MKRRLARPAWQDAVSTTCDFARNLLIVDFGGDREISRHKVDVPDEGPVQRAARIEALLVQEVVCGAISRPLATALAQAGIHVFPFVAGSVEDVLAAHLSGRLGEPTFLLAGCQPGSRHKWRHGERHSAKTRKGRR